MNKNTKNAAWLSGRRLQGTLLGLDVQQSPDGQDLPYAFIVPSQDSGLSDGTVLKVLLPNSAKNSENMQLNMAAAHDGHVRNLNSNKTLNHFVESARVLRESGTHAKAAANRIFMPLYVSNAQGKPTSIKASDMIFDHGSQPTRQTANYLLGQRSLAHVVEQVAGRPVPFHNNAHVEYDVESLSQGINNVLDKHGSVITVAIDNFMPVGNALAGGGYRHPLQGQIICIDNVNSGEVLMEQGQPFTATVLAGSATNLTVTNDPLGIIHAQKNQKQLSLEGDDGHDTTIFANGKQIDRVVAPANDVAQQAKPLYHIDLPAGDSVERKEFQRVDAKVDVAVATAESKVISTGISAGLSFDNSKDAQKNFSPATTPLLHELFQHIKGADAPKFSDKEMAAGVQSGILIGAAGQSNGRLHIAGGANFVFKQDKDSPLSFSDQLKNGLTEVLNLTHPAFANYIPSSIYEKIQNYINDEPANYKTALAYSGSVASDKSPHGLVFDKYVNLVNDNKEFFYEATKDFVANETNASRPEYAKLAVFAERMRVYEDKEVDHNGERLESINVYSDFIRYIKKEPGLFTEITAAMPGKEALNRSMENLVMLGTQMEKDYLAALTMYQTIKNEALGNNLVQDGTLTLGVGEDAIKIPVPKTFTQKDFFNGLVKVGQNTLTFTPIDPLLENDPKERKKLEEYNAKLKKNGDEGKKLLLTDASHRGFSNTQQAIAGLVMHHKQVTQEHLDKVSPLNNPTLVVTPVKLFESKSEKELNQHLNSKGSATEFNPLTLKHPELKGFMEATVPSGQSLIIGKNVKKHEELRQGGEGYAIETQGASPLTDQRNTRAHLHASQVLVSNNNLEAGGEATRTAIHIESAKNAWPSKNWDFLPTKCVAAYDLFLERKQKRETEGNQNDSSISLSLHQLYTESKSANKTLINKLTMTRGTADLSFSPTNISFDEQGLPHFSPTGAIPALSTSSHSKGQVLADTPVKMVYHEQDGKISRAEYTQKGDQKSLTHNSYLIEHADSVVETLKAHPDGKLMTPDIRVVTDSANLATLEHCTTCMFEARYFDGAGNEHRDARGRLLTNFATGDFENLVDSSYPYVSPFNPEKSVDPSDNAPHADELGADWDDNDMTANQQHAEQLVQAFVGADTRPPPQSPPQNNNSYDAPSPDF